MSIIKEEDIDDCDEYAPAAIGESGLHDLAKIDIHAEEGFTATMISDDADQEVVDAAEEDKGDGQAGH
nr:hypothetical protein CFP56_23299 [Quercus suber]